MRFLIIDDDRDYRAILRYHLGVGWPDATIDEHAPSPAGAAAVRTKLPDYDAVLLGHPVARERGFEWLAALRAARDAPPVLVFADPSDEFLAVDALGAGAASYFPKRKVRHRRLIERVRAAVGAGPPDAAGGQRAGDAPEWGPNRYRLLDTLYRSNLVSVFLAETDDGAAPLAFKVIRYVPDTGGGHLFDRFLQEYDVIARIHHPNVVKIFDLGVADDHAYIAMEYLAAGSLAQRMTSGLDIGCVLAYLRQIANALAAIHRAGVLHRDLKPANIMFRDDDSLALIDFGLAKQVQLEAAMTGSGLIFGTPYYMSPEQGHAEPADHRADIYSLGCVFHEMLTGRRPFDARSPMGIIYRHAHAPRPRLEPRLEAFQEPLDRMLAVDPAARFQSADELLAALDPLDGGAIDSSAKPRSSHLTTLP